MYVCVYRIAAPVRRVHTLAEARVETGASRIMGFICFLSHFTFCQHFCLHLMYLFLCKLLLPAMMRTTVAAGATAAVSIDSHEISSR